MEQDDGKKKEAQPLGDVQGTGGDRGGEGRQDAGGVGAAI